MLLVESSDYVRLNVTGRAGLLERLEGVDLLRAGLLERLEGVDLRAGLQERLEGVGRLRAGLLERLEGVGLFRSSGLGL